MLTQVHIVSILGAIVHGLVMIFYAQVYFSYIYLNHV
jgi:hypothetical protein